MNNWTICIPSYRRSSILTTQTLKCLEDIDPTLIKIFVVEEEADIYREAVEGKYEVIVGVKGIARQREFIENYFPLGSQLVFLDDDIKSFDFSLAFPECDINLSKFIDFAFTEIQVRNAYIWGVYPVFNKFFRKERKMITEELSLCVGPFYGIINRPNDPELKIKVTTEMGNKEDVERSILYFKKDGKVVRFNKVGFETKYYGNVGGIGTLQERMNQIIYETEQLCKTYNGYGTLQKRKNGIHEFKLYKLQPFEQNDKMVTQLPSVPIEECDKIYKALSSITIRKLSTINSRKGFEKQRSCVFGIVRSKYQGTVGLSKYSIDYPDIYQALKEFGKIVCGDFEFDSIQVNHNVTSPRHKDKGNIGKSIIISVGDYTGSQLGTIQNDIEIFYDTNNKPILFNGAVVEHFNTPDLKGNKYSIIFYNNWSKKI